MFVDVSPGDFPIAAAKLTATHTSLLDLLITMAPLMAPTPAAADEVSAVAASGFGGKAGPNIAALVENIQNGLMGAAVLGPVGLAYQAADIADGASITANQVQPH